MEDFEVKANGYYEKENENENAALSDLALSLIISGSIILFAVIIVVIVILFRRKRKIDNNNKEIPLALVNDN